LSGKIDVPVLVLARHQAESHFTPVRGDGRRGLSGSFSLDSPTARLSLSRVVRYNQSRGPTPKRVNSAMLRFLGFFLNGPIRSPAIGFCVFRRQKLRQARSNIRTNCGHYRPFHVRPIIVWGLGGAGRQWRFFNGNLPGYEPDLDSGWRKRKSSLVGEGGSKEIKKKKKRLCRAPLGQLVAVSIEPLGTWQPG